MSHTTDTRTVELARKAVGNIMVDTIDSLDSYEEDDEAISVFSEEELITINQREKEPEPLPEPQPALKVNSAASAISRASVNEQRREKPKSRYLFIDAEEDEDEYAPIRRYNQKFRERREPERREPERREPERREPERREPKHREPEHVEYDHYEDERYEPASYRAKREDVTELANQQKRERPRKAPKQRPRSRQEENDEPAYVEVAPATVRSVAIGLSLLFLMIMVFLVYRNNIMARDLQEANERLASVAEMEDRLIRAETDLLARDYELQLALTELANWQSGHYNNPQTGTYNGGGETPYIPNIPPTTPAFPTTHIVIAGQNLSRIAELHYGELSHALAHIHALHIASANNIPYPYELQLGMELIIPPPPA